ELNPWRAALLARSVLKHDDDHRAWAVLGLAHTLLGHFQAAARAYRRAIRLHPTCASYRHNLGHLLDVALNQPRAALRHLAEAHRSAPDEDEIASSYAHALLRSLRMDDARRVLKRVFGGEDADRVEPLLARWLKRDQASTAKAKGTKAIATDGAAEAAPLRVEPDIE